MKSSLENFRGTIVFAKKTLSERIKKNPLYFLLIISIITISVFFRTYNYHGRVYIQADNSRDVQVAQYAFDNLKIPQIGQFSSAGPFFYGPWYYWFLEIISFLPLGSLTHWYAITGIYLIFIYLIYWLGKETGGKYVGILSALFAAISPAQINYSFSTWNPAIVPTLSLLILIFLVRLFKYKKNKDIFLLGFLTSLAITIHFQSILISPVLLIAIFLIKKFHLRFVKNLSFLVLGFIVPLVPLVRFDMNHNWYNFKSLFIFLAIDQYTIWVPNRWLTYIGTYWPDTWSFIVGGNNYLSGLIIVSLSIFTIFKLKDFLHNKTFFLIAVAFLLEIIMYRYYRGERFQYYSLFAHPAVFVLTAWVSIQILRIQKFIGIIFVTLIIFGTTNLALKDIAERSISYPKIENIKKEIYLQYPNEKFDIYGCKYNAALVSHPLALMMYYDRRNDTNGIKIGVCSSADPKSWVTIIPEDENYSADFWIDNSTAIVYESTVEWWRQKPPGGGGDFWQFLKKNLNPKCYPHC